METFSQMEFVDDQKLLQSDNYFGYGQTIGLIVRERRT